MPLLFTFTDTQKIKLSIQPYAVTIYFKNGNDSVDFKQFTTTFGVEMKHLHKMDLGNYEFIGGNQKAHSTYHQFDDDKNPADFHRSQTHSHMQFERPVDDILLIVLLTKLEKCQLITHEEKSNIVFSYYSQSVRHLHSLVTMTNKEAEPLFKSLSNERETIDTRTPVTPRFFQPTPDVTRVVTETEENLSLSPLF